jgi:hypothetical protein
MAQDARPPAPPSRWLAPATAVLALGLALVAVLGPLVTGAIDYRVAPPLRDQLVGSDLVALVVLAPLTLLAAELIRRGSPAGARLALATSATAWYFAAELVLGPDRTGRPGNDEAFLPLFLGLLLLSATVAVGSWRPARVPAGDGGRRGRLATGSLLLLVVVLFVVGRYLPAWLAVVHGTPSADYREGPAVWWAVAFEDLALLLPAAAATAIGLFRKTAWSATAAFGVTGSLALIGAAVVAMAWSTTLHGDPGSTAGTATAMTVIGIGTALPAVVWWTAAGRRPRLLGPQHVRDLRPCPGSGTDVLASVQGSPASGP